MHSIKHLGMAMTEQHRSGTDEIIDIFIAVLVPDTRSLALADDYARIEIAEPARRQNRSGAFDPFLLRDRPLQTPSIELRHRRAQHIGIRNDP